MTDQLFQGHPDITAIPQYLSIQDQEILKDCSSCSQILIGSFIKNQPGQNQAVLLRGNDTLEMYSIHNSQFHFVTKYQITNGKCTEMTSLRLTWSPVDVIIIMIPRDKFIMLEFDEDTSEFKIFAMHNFTNDPELKDVPVAYPFSLRYKCLPEIQESGKRNPLSGKLRSISSYYLTCFGYIADDNKFAWVELRQAVLPDLMKYHSSQTAVNIIETSRQKRLNENYLNAWGKDIEYYLKPARFRNLKNLCQNDHEKLVGTSSRQNISKLAILQFIQPNNESTELIYLYAVDYLSFYVRNIIRSTPSDVGAYSIYVILQEKKRFVVIQICSLANILDQENAKIKEEKRVEQGEYSVKNIIDQRQMELRLDGCTRVISLPGRKMLIFTEKGFVYMMHVQFDQADLDVADAHFSIVKTDSPITPSSIVCIENLNPNEFQIFVSSYFNDQSIFSLKQVPESEDQGSEKRQKIDESISVTQRVRFDQRYELILNDALTTISPITDVIQFENSQNDMELVTVSGYHSRSYLTFIKSSLPYDVLKRTPIGSQVRNIFTIRDLKQKDSSDSFIILSLHDSTRILDSTKGLNEVFPGTTVDFIFDETTISCQSVGVQSPQRILQVTATNMTLLSLEGKLIRKHNFEEAKVISVGKYLGCSDLIFVFLNTGKIQVFMASSLQVQEKIDCGIINQTKLTITAVSTCSFNDESNYSFKIIQNIGEYIIIAYKEKGLLRFYRVNDLNSKLDLTFEIKHISQQFPFLANQLMGKQEKYIYRSPTDLSIMLDTDYQTQQISLDKTYITEVQFIELQSQKVLLITLSNRKLMVYQNLNSFPDQKKEKFRFKLLQAQNLKIKVREDLDIDQFLNGHSLPQNIIQQGQNQVIILLSPDSAPLTLTEMKGKLLVHKLQVHDKEKITAYSQLLHKTLGKGGIFLYFDSTTQSMNIAKSWQIFDVSKTSKFTDSYTIKQVIFDGRCIKKACLHTCTSNNKQYIVLATFQQVKGDQKDVGQKLTDAQRGFSTLYNIEVYQMPQVDSMKSYTALFEPSQVIKKQMNIDEIVISLESVKLKIQDGSLKNFIAVSTLMIDSAMMEEGFYSSFLNLFEIEPQERRLKFACVEAFKGPITCLSCYQGHLVTVQKSQRLKDLAVVFFKFNENKSEKLEPSAQPQSIKTLGTSISFDGDHIIVGDIQKNIRVLWLCDREELKKEKIEDIQGIIKLKHLYSNTMDSQVIGAYSLRINPIIEPFNNHYERLNEVERQQFTILTASDEGYIRLFQLREKFLLENMAQINIQDHINKIVPLGLERNKPLIEQRRRFIIVPKRGGLFIVTTIDEQEYACTDSLIEAFSKSLPHRGGIAPIIAHKMPNVPVNEKNTVVERLNRNAVDKRTISQYYFMSSHLQRIFSDKIGFSEATLNEFFAIN